MNVLQEEHHDWVRCCDSDRLFLVTSGNSRKIVTYRIGDLGQGESNHREIKSLQSFETNQNVIETIKILSKSDGQNSHLCLTGSRDKTIQCWDFL